MKNSEVRKLTLQNQLQRRVWEAMNDGGIAGTDRRVVEAVIKLFSDFLRSDEAREVVARARWLDDAESICEALAAHVEQGK